MQAKSNSGQLLLFLGSLILVGPHINDSADDSSITSEVCAGKIGSGVVPIDRSDDRRPFDRLSVGIDSFGRPLPMAAAGSESSTGKPRQLLPGLYRQRRAFCPGTRLAACP